MSGNTRTPSSKRRQTNRWARFAEVGVRLAPAAKAAVVVCADVSGRHRSAAVDDARNAADAQDGAWYALKELPDDANNFLVEITEIITAPADTGPGDVKFAAAQAVWQALGYVPSDPPFIGKDGSPVFPSSPAERERPAASGENGGSN
ncbi:hypothetical protein ACW4TU_45485 (plasmid) [Streptomyces sp. QTS52]